MGGAASGAVLDATMSSGSGASFQLQVDKSSEDVKKRLLHLLTQKHIQMLQMLEALKKEKPTLMEHLQPARSGFGSQAG